MNATVQYAIKVRKDVAEGGLRLALERNYWIRDKQAKVALIRLNWMQVHLLEEYERQMRERGYVRIIVLKARQLGCSTLAEGIGMLFAALKANSYNLVLSHESESAKYLYGMGSRAIECYSENHDDGEGTVQSELKSDRMSGLIFGAPLNSVIQVATARNAGSGRSRTLQFVHISECAFFENADELMLGLLQAIPDRGSVAIIESTANGLGNFFSKTWESAESCKSDFKPLFYPWHEHPEYRREFPGDEDRQRFEQGLSSVERELVDAHDLDLEQLKWRRWSILTNCAGDIDQFKQEYPATPEEAFLVSGRPAFDATGLAKLLRHCREKEPIRKGYFGPFEVPDLAAYGYIPEANG